MADLRVGIIGYGLAGRSFHAPLIASTPGLAVAAILTRNPERRGQAALEHPGARLIGAVEELWESAPDLVVIASPNESHAALARAAIDHGVPVVVDKPLAVSAAQAEALINHAHQAGTLLTVFQNRRWDTDHLTLIRLMGEGALGEVTRYESRFERWRPETDPNKWRETVGPDRGGGQLIDLGAHLIDQALTLFGAAASVYAEIASHRGEPADDDAFLALRHHSGVLSHLHVSAVTPSVAPRLRVQGTRGGFVVTALDPQEDALRGGERPDASPSWGAPAEWARGRLVAGEQSVPVPAVPGYWPRFYSLLRDALSSGGPPPVDPRDALAVLRVIEAARASAAERRIVPLTP